MVEIGYYNYYNVKGRPSPDKPQDRYKQMVEKYEGDELKAVSDLNNPYSDRNQKIRALDEKLAPMGEELRTRFSDYDEADKYLCKKYFGKERIGYTMQDTEPEKYAMYKNDLNVVMYGTVMGGYGIQFKDPRLNFDESQFEDIDAVNAKTRQESISNQISHLLENNKIELDDETSLLISFNPYSYEPTIDGTEDLNLKQTLINALTKNNNSKNLMFYAMSNQDKDEYSLAKFRAYHTLLDYTGLDLSTLTLKEDGYYTSDDENVLDLLKEKLKDNSKVPMQFRGQAYDYTKELLDTVSQKGWNNIEDLKISIGFNKKDGFYLLNQEWSA